MGQMLHIGSDGAYALASELAGLKGLSMAAAVTEALRAKLDAERRARSEDKQVRHVLDMAARVRANMSHPLPSSDLSDMYDADGLPV